MRYGKDLKSSIIEINDINANIIIKGLERIWSEPGAYVERMWEVSGWYLNHL